MSTSRINRPHRKSRGRRHTVSAYKHFEYRFYRMKPAALACCFASPRHIETMRRIPQLDGVRAVAILLVFLHHAFNVRLGKNFHALWLGVDIFFVLSGFLITGVLLDAKDRPLRGYFAHFYDRRARRLLAPYALALVMVTIIFGFAWAHYWYFYFLLTNLLIPLDVPRPRCVEPFWSLAVEEQFYLVWPLVIYFLSKRRLAQLSLALLVIVPLLRGLIHFSNHWIVYMFTPFRMDLFAAGALISLLWRSRPEVIQKGGTLAGCGACVIGTVTLFALFRCGITADTNSTVSNIFIYESTLLIGAGILLFALAGRYVGWLRIRPMVYIGTISYSMYLIHMCMLDLPFTAKLPDFAVPVVAFLLTVLYAALSWTWMESRLLGRRARKGRESLQQRPETFA